MHLCLIALLSWGQSISGQFAPPAGQEGSTAIAADSNVFVRWADECQYFPSWQNIADTTLGLVSYGEPEDALGQADGSVLSLGDGGRALFHFEPPLADGEGFDFAVFENGFSDSFLELAFVEVSSDGEHFFRFPSVSLTPTNTQVGTFDTLDATLLHNLAGKYRMLFGTPFDLQEMQGLEDLDVMHITDVAIVDVVGSIDSAYATYDSQGNIVNDPFPTPFPGGGFDLDALGVIHDVNNAAVGESTMPEISLVPNPVKDFVRFYLPGGEMYKARLYDVSGNSLQELMLTNGSRTDLHYLSPGVYFLKLSGEKQTAIKLLKY